MLRVEEPMPCSLYSPEVFRESSSAGHSEKQAIHFQTREEMVFWGYSGLDSEGKTPNWLIHSEIFAGISLLFEEAGTEFIA